MLGQTMGAIFKMTGMAYEADGVLYINSKADRAMKAMLPTLNWTKLVAADSNPEIRLPNGEPWNDQSLVVNWMNYFGIDVRYLNDKSRMRNVKGETFELNERMERSLREAGLLSG